MLRKKCYRRPTVETEEILEQASLACTATAGPSEEGEVTFTAAECEVDVAKGGAFVDWDPSCTEHLNFPEDLVILS